MPLLVGHTPCPIHFPTAASNQEAQVTFAGSHGKAQLATATLHVQL